MHLFFTRVEDVVVPSAAGDPAFPISRTYCIEQGIQEGVPFFLSDDGELATEVNEFFAQLPVSGGASRHTWEGYGRDIHHYLRWLGIASPGLDWWEVSAEVLQAYKRFRSDPERGADLGARGWNRAASAIVKLYRWALSRKLIQQLPFTVEELAQSSAQEWERSPSTDLHRKADSAYPRPAWLGGDQFSDFVQIGLAHTDGRAGRHALRNRTVADLLAQTGLRESETVILRWELPPEEHLSRLVERGDSLMSWQVPAGLGKGRKSRETIVSPAALLSIWTYAKVERAVVMAQAARGTSDYLPVRRPIKVELLLDKNGRGTGRFVDLETGISRRIDRVNEQQRLRMVELINGRWRPVALFLSNAGRPMSGQSWQSVFRDASARCAKMGYADLGHVTPHVLRHTFAVNYLEFLERERARVRAQPGVVREIDMLSSMSEVQRCLGHVGKSTTRIYLHEVGNRVHGANLAAEAYFASLTRLP